MERRWAGLTAGVGAGALVGAAGWLAVDPVPGCLLFMSLPPQGVCESRLGTITPLGPGESAAPFALTTGAAAAVLAGALTLGSPWRRWAILAAVVAVAVGALVMPVACHWTIPADRTLQPDALARRCTNVVGVTTVARPQDAASWSIATGLIAMATGWLLDRHRRSAADP